jgi:hypothetical protein
MFAALQSMFSSWNERYVAVIGHTLFVFADLDTAANGTPELSLDLCHCVVTSYFVDRYAVPCRAFTRMHASLGG